MAARGWYSGSTHVHMNCGGNLHNTLENMMMMSDAEGQYVAIVQIANKDNRVLDYPFFVPSGGPHPLSRTDRLLVIGQEYRPLLYGHVSIFGMRDHLISPFATGYEGTAIESLYPSNTDMFCKAKAQGATVAYVHALGTTDAVEWSTSGWRRKPTRRPTDRMEKHKRKPRPEFELSGMQITNHWTGFCL